MSTIMGIDVSKKTMNVAVIMETKTIVEDKYSLDLLGLNEIRNLYEQYQTEVIVFESTGVYSRRLEAYIVQNGLRYHLLNPLVAKKRLDDGSRLRKNDRRDALGLARTETRPEAAGFTQPKVPVYIELADMSRFYEQLNEDKKRVKNRIHRVMQLTFATFTDEFDLDTPSSLAILKHYPNSELLRNKDLTEIEDELRSWHLRGMGEIRVKNYAKKLFKVASRNQAAVRAGSHNDYQLTYQINQLQQLMQEQQELIQRMSEVAEKLPEKRLLQSLPGIGESTAVRLIGELGDLRRFDTSQQINSYIGIDLTLVDSGDSLSARHITKHGNPYARRILYWTIVNQVNSTASDNHIRDLYNKKRQSTSSKKKLIGCLMDHLLRTIFHLIKTNQTYSYEIAVSR